MTRHARRNRAACRAAASAPALALAATLALLALLALLSAPQAARAQIETHQAELDALFAELQDPDNPGWKQAEKEIWRIWSESGSGAMDFLLRRGRNAMQAGHPDIAVEHFSALIDHAPDFAEGWNARATAYFMQGEFALSIADIEQVLARNPRHFGALAGLGTMLEQMGDEKNALEAYRASLALNPHQDQVREAVERLEKKLSGTSL